jgi:hypothetical protein
MGGGQGLVAVEVAAGGVPSPAVFVAVPGVAAFAGSPLLGAAGAVVQSGTPVFL